MAFGVLWFSCARWVRGPNTRGDADIFTARYTIWKKNSKVRSGKMSRFLPSLSTEVCRTVPAISHLER